jgi:hypothetical protein
MWTGHQLVFNHILDSPNVNLGHTLQGIFYSLCNGFSISGFHSLHSASSTENSILNQISVERYTAPVTLNHNRLH